MLSWAEPEAQCATADNAYAFLAGGGARKNKKYSRYKRKREEGTLSACVCVY